MGKMARRFAFGAFLAGAVGYLTGLLTAPKSGKETRADIKHAASQGLAQAEKELKTLHTELTALLNKAKVEAENLKGTARKDLDDLIKVANVAREKAREILSAMHEGHADDKDLKKAIEDATKAIDHLKSYVKK